MFTNPWFYAALIGVAIILVLSVIAIKLLAQLKQQKIQQAEAEKAQKLALQRHDHKVLSSVIIIVRAIKEEQCDLAEGCWRLSVLLDSLKLSEALEQEFPSIYQLYNGIKHMPILEARKKLSKKERMKLDYERMKLEAELTEKIHQDIKLLHQYANERSTSLAANIA